MNICVVFKSDGLIAGLYIDLEYGKKFANRNV